MHARGLLRHARRILAQGRAECDGPRDIAIAHDEQSRRIHTEAERARVLEILHDAPTARAAPGPAARQRFRLRRAFAAAGEQGESADQHDARDGERHHELEQSTSPRARSRVMRQPATGAPMDPHDERRDALGPRGSRQRTVMSMRAVRRRLRAENLERRFQSRDHRQRGARLALARPASVSSSGAAPLARTRSARSLAMPSASSRRIAAAVLEQAPREQRCATEHADREHEQRDQRFQEREPSTGPPGRAHGQPAAPGRNARARVPSGSRRAGAAARARLRRR